MEPALLPRERVWWKTGIRLPWVMWMPTKIKRCHRCATYPKWRSSCQHIYCQEHNDQKSKFPELQPCITSLKSHCHKCLHSLQEDLPEGTTIKVGHTSSLTILTVSFQYISFFKGSVWATATSYHVRTLADLTTTNFFFALLTGNVVTR